MGDDKKLNTTVDDFLTEKNKSDKKEPECQTQECRMKVGDGILERIDKKLVNKDGKQLLIN